MENNNENLTQTNENVQPVVENTTPAVPNIDEAPTISLEPTSPEAVEENVVESAPQVAQETPVEVTQQPVSEEVPPVEAQPEPTPTVDMPAAPVDVTVENQMPAETSTPVEEVKPKKSKTGLVLFIILILLIGASYYLYTKNKIEIPLLDKVLKKNNVAPTPETPQEPTSEEQNNVPEEPSITYEERYKNESGKSLSVDGDSGLESFNKQLAYIYYSLINAGVHGKSLDNYTDDEMVGLTLSFVYLNYNSENGDFDKLNKKMFLNDMKKIIGKTIDFDKFISTKPLEEGAYLIGTFSDVEGMDASYNKKTDKFIPNGRTGIANVENSFLISLNCTADNSTCYIDSKSIYFDENEYNYCILQEESSTKEKNEYKASIIDENRNEVATITYDDLKNAIGDNINNCYEKIVDDFLSQNYSDYFITYRDTFKLVDGNYQLVSSEVIK